MGQVMLANGNGTAVDAAKQFLYDECIKHYPEERCRYILSIGREIQRDEGGLKWYVWLGIGFVLGKLL
jgi:hypothetical protein